MSSCSSLSPVMARSASRGEHRSGGGRFRAEIEMDRGVALLRSPELGFAAAVREPLVRLQRPRFDFERWDWEYFAWPHDRPDANLEMRDSDPTATFEADRKEIEGFLSRSTLQLEASQSTAELEASQSTPHLEAIQGILDQTMLHLEADGGIPSQSTPLPEASEGFPSPRTPKLEIDDDMLFGHGAPWRRGCAESNPFLLEHCKALQGRCAF
ncbi:uncharacterized protein [Lolium perenne]|uniref:uncharacterized protein n=1 Tax=Lolium perenne TaxID=4522 RepID=UPI0021F61A50|nr:uncharacterized protein LOC127311340 [Lolium perenne]